MMLLDLVLVYVWLVALGFVSSYLFGVILGSRPDPRGLFVAVSVFVFLLVLGAVIQSFAYEPGVHYSF